MLQSNIFSDRIVHGFTTSQYDLSPGSADWDQSDVFFGAGYSFALVSQVHGNDVIHAEQSGILGKADALQTDKKGLVLAIRTADCVPILVEAAHRVFAIHAGWRGIANGIIEKTLQGVPDLYAAVIGPCISVEAYEVGEEVIEGILQTGVPREVFVQERQPRPHVDLKQAAHHQLQRAGVPNIDVLPHCTFLDKGFHSYRRDQNRSGRLAALIGFRLPV